MFVRERIVLVSRDAGLRSGLAARLGMAGFALVTIDGDADVDFADHASDAYALLLDHSAVPDGGRNLDPRTPCWPRIILIGGDEEVPQGGIVRVDRRNVAEAVLTQLSRWS